MRAILPSSLAMKGFLTGVGLPCRERWGPRWRGQWRRRGASLRNSHPTNEDAALRPLRPPPLHRCGLLPLLLSELAHRGVERGREQKAEAGHAEHAGEYRGAQRLPHLGARAGRDDQRSDAEDEGQRCHQNRPQPRARGADGGLRRGSAVVLGLPGELHDQNRVLGRQSDQNHETDLRQHVDRHAARRSVPVTEANRHIGTIITTASGNFQLSY